MPAMPGADPARRPDMVLHLRRFLRLPPHLHPELKYLVDTPFSPSLVTYASSPTSLSSSTSGRSSTVSSPRSLSTPATASSIVSSTCPFPPAPTHWSSSL
ncbi:hypothetical protein TB2_017658 [Malus domestica]